MSDIPQNVWDLAKLLHDTRDQFCWGKHQSHHRHKWPGDEVTPHNYGHNPQPWVDIALAQAKAVLKSQAK